MNPPLVSKIIKVNDTLKYSCQPLEKGNNNYTDDDIEDCFQGFEYFEIIKGLHCPVKYRGMDSILERNNILVSLKLGESNRDEISTLTLYSVLKRESFISPNENLMLLYDFIHNVSLDDAPMYINTFPDFFKWRMRIGK